MEKITLEQIFDTIRTEGCFEGYMTPTHKSGEFIKENAMEISLFLNEENELQFMSSEDSDGNETTGNLLKDYILCLKNMFKWNEPTFWIN